MATAHWFGWITEGHSITVSIYFMKKHYILFIMTLHPLLTSCRKRITLQQLHSVHQISTPPPPPSLKNTTPLFLSKSPLKYANCPSPLPLFFRQYPLYIGFSRIPPPPLHVGFFSERTHKVFTLNSILSFKSN